MHQKPKSFVSNVIASRGHLLRLVFANDITGKKAYYYIMIDNNKISLFDSIFKDEDRSGILNLSDYGKIIKSAYGEPSEEIKKEMLDKYDFYSE